VLVINHDASFDGVVIETSNYAALQNLRLSNGEFIPRLQQFIDIIKTQDKTKLIIEIKPHSTIANENRVVAAVVNLVNDNGVAHLVDYISFSENVCNKLIKTNPQHRVAYLNGNKTPEQLKSAGYWGLDYESSILKNHTDWVNKATELGLTTNVWTVNSESDIMFFINLDVDYITTDNPQFFK
jgi:glycerophosphoryl diester phosphodiesterase